MLGSCYNPEKPPRDIAGMGPLMALVNSGILIGISATKIRK